MNLGIYYHGVDTTDKLDFVLKNGIRPSGNSLHLESVDEVWLTRQVDLAGYSTIALFKVDLSGLEKQITFHSDDWHIVAIDCPIEKERIKGAMVIPPRPAKANADMWALEYIRNPNSEFKPLL